MSGASVNVLNAVVDTGFFLLPVIGKVGIHQLRQIFSEPPLTYSSHLLRRDLHREFVESQAMH